MSNPDSAGFGQFVPGFDFLQNLAKGAGASVPQMPNLGSWVAPTLNVEELDKRIEELKNVQFWLEQNSRALSATIQALEVQRMTLATLKGMNFDLADLAKAFTPKAAEKPAEKAPEPKPAPAPEPAAEAAEPKATAKAAAHAAGMVDPLQLWGSLAQQFQHIAATALKDVSAQVAAKPGAPAKKAAAKKAPARKSAARKPGGKPASKTSRKTAGT
jgi:hypothetical protein